MARRRGVPWWLEEEFRQALTFVVGLGLGVHEVLLTDGERPFMLAFIATLIGVPVYGLLGRYAEQLRSREDREDPRG